MSYKFNVFTGTLDQVNAGSVTSVALADTSTTPIYTVTNSPITSSGTIDITLNTEPANDFFAGPTSGPAAQPTFRAIVPADVPTLNQNTTGTASNVTGVVAIVNGGTGQTTANAAFDALSPMTTAGDVIYENATPTAARLPIGTTGQVLTVSGGLPIWASSATSGTVTSVGFADTSTTPIYTITNSPVTSSGTIDQTLNTQSANIVFAGPTSGPAAQPTFRAVVPSDIPTLNQNTTGSAGSFTGSLSGDVTGTQSATVVATVGTSSAANIHSAELAANAATSSNTPNTIVKRDGSGNFSAGTITSSLTGHASADLALVGGTMSGAIDMGTNQIHNVVNPTGAQDAATKSYVDAGLAALNPAQSVYAASTTNIVGTYNNGVGGIGATFTVTASGAFSIDGVSPPLNSRILLKDQTSGFQNGIYNLTVVGTGLTSPVLTRSLDYDMPSDINNVGLIPVINGIVNALSSWQQIATITTVGTDSLIFTEFTANPSLYLLKANNLSDVASKNASRGPSGLNIDERSTFSNAPYTVLSTDRYVAQIGTMTAPRIVTLPAANSINAGQLLIIADESGTVGTTNTLTITAAGSDTINGSANKTIRSAYGEAYLISNGTNGWFRPVTGIGSGGTGLSTTPTDGQLLIGQTSTNSYVQSTLTAGSNVTITNGSGSITVAATSGASSTLTGYASSPGIISATDTVLTGIEKLNGNDQIFLNDQTTTYTIVASDFNKLVRDTSSGAIAFNLTSPATLGNGWHCYIKNVSTGTQANSSLNIIPASGTIDGASSIFTYPGDLRLVTCDGTNFLTQLLTGGYVEYSTSGTSTFFVPSKIEYAHVELWGGGGGGGSGRRGAAATARSGGCGGGGGTYVEQWFKVADLPTSLTVTIGAVAAGGAARTTDDTSGVAGSDGNNSTFGTLLTAYAGGGGGAGTAAAVNGGGGGGSLTAAVANVGGGPNASANGNSLGGATGNTGIGGENAYGGAAGGGTTAGASGKNGGNSFRGGSGAGGGGGITAADATSVGGAGGGSQGAVNGTGGSFGTNPGGAGGNGTAGPTSYGPGTAGGGGGSSKTAAGGNGGNGGIACGGGGGGASLDGFNSGAGGEGGSGYCRIWYG